MTAALKQATQIKIQMNVVKGPHAGQQFLFYKIPLTIGRGPENDIVLLNDPLVSRVHAKIEWNQNVFELTNLSEKNVLLVHGEVVKKSALMNDSVFQIGDSEFSFQFDSGKAVVSMPTKLFTEPEQPHPDSKAVNQSAPLVKTAAPKPADLKIAVAVPTAKVGAIATSQTLAAAPNQPKIQSAMNPYTAQMGYRTASPPASTQNNKVRFYTIVGIAICIIGYLILSPASKVKGPKAKPMLKYEDEIAVTLKSEKEDGRRKKREEDKKNRNSPQILRAEENFIKGMRDFQLGNYARAQDFFQVVLNLIPDHPLARRHLYLSKVRFDELVQAKLMLGESNYQKHNFSMCESLYKQVMDMLQGKSNDQKFQLAQRMAEKCQFAAEGIR